ncbi:MAG TPA: dihydrofolate reductase [Gemmatimonadales bacterium]|nr:dihydrofolate reductase [Gemmatimonadales bacterium]
MRLTLVAAMTEDRVIGRENGLPWHLPEDLRHFKRLTLGHPVVMGRRTWESVGEPLAGRHNIVVTRQPGYAAPGAEVVASLDAALRLVRDEPEVFVVGGAELYRAALPRADRVHLTLIHTRDVPGDTRFPPFEGPEWDRTEEGRHPADARHAWPLTFLRYDRRR